METTKLEDNANDLADHVRPHIDEVKRRVESLNGRVNAFIKEHPAACLLGAFALGYVIARVARREQS